MGFLDNYEDVASRIKRFWAAYPSGRIETHIIDFNAVAGYILIECRLFREYEDEKPSAIDFGFGRVESYQASMKRWFVEDTVTSAIGRAIGLLLGSDTRPTQENMKQVEHMPAAFVNKVEDDPWSNSFAEDGFATAATGIAEIVDQLGGEILAEAPQCKHGHMLLKQGTSPKTGKDYRGHVCVEKVKANQCPAIWYVIGSDGKWKVQS
ncbi:MAG: hypothetical protein EHM38_05150 [Geobacteraceae bacterium]|nr:MAG: hypothetical protein EHM38_05150 [Geobacteraceae bacterium]